MDEAHNYKSLPSISRHDSGELEAVLRTVTITVFSAHQSPRLHQRLKTLSRAAWQSGRGVACEWDGGIPTA